MPPGIKLSGLNQDGSPTVTDSVPIYDVEGTATKRTLISTLISLMFNNIPTGSPSPITRWDESFYDYFVPGTGIWTGDAYGSTRAASMTSATVYINGRRIVIPAVAARIFTASRDTYIDVLDNGNGTGSLVYTEVANNAVSPALAPNSVRMAIIITGASTIANVGSINQGQTDKLLPLLTVPVIVTDALGNLIYNTTPMPTVIGYRQITADGTSTTAGNGVAILAAPVIIPTGRRIRVYSSSIAMYNGGANSTATAKIWEGNVGTTQIVENTYSSSAQGGSAPYPERTYHPTPGTKIYNLSLISINGFTVYYAANSNSPAFLAIELV